MMMRFDLSKYATVAERLAQLKQDWPDSRIITEITHVDGEIGKTRWVVKTTLYLTAGDQANGLAQATGHAFEIDGTGGANSTSALENCESSSLGRCLMVAGYSMNKDPQTLASVEELQKVERASQRDWKAEGDKLTDVSSLRKLYTQARAANAPADVLDWLKARGESLDSGK
jgi:hypothetical protein